MTRDAEEARERATPCSDALQERFELGFPAGADAARD